MERLEIDRAVSIPNRFCPYCAKPIPNRGATKDHVVSRKFVPEGTMADTFNIQLQCHAKCNGQKAKLEDDISAITMMPFSNGHYARDDDRLIRSSKRKTEGSVSQATKRKVASSQSNLKIEYQHAGGATLKFGLTGSPYLDPTRVRQLAYLQMQGFRFFQTYNKETAFGDYIPYSKFVMLSFLQRGDWGNPVATEFTKQLAEWEPLFHMVTADGYFRCLIRKSHEHELWGWALEWNEAYRVFGFWGDANVVERVADTMPELEPLFIWGDKINGLASRQEVPLAPELDVLFGNPDGYDDMPIVDTPHWR